MTPKEKAKELVDKYRAFCNSVRLNTFIGNLVYDEEVETKNAKQCALIAVDEMENILTEYGDESYELQNMDRTFAYLQQVKQEIDNL